MSKEKNSMSKLERALQIWTVLIGKAYNRQILTYGELAEIIGFRGAGVLGTYLDFIMRYCDNKKYPPLTCIVVNKKEGKPGEGLITIDRENFALKREEVFNYKWYQLPPMRIENFNNLDKH